MHLVIIRIRHRIKAFPLGRHTDLQVSAEIAHTDGDFIPGGVFKHGDKRLLRHKKRSVFFIVLQLVLLDVAAYKRQHFLDFTFSKAFFHIFYLYMLLWTDSAEDPAVIGP